jgi:hypothetical protein
MKKYTFTIQISIIIIIKIFNHNFFLISYFIPSLPHPNKQQSFMKKTKMKKESIFQLLHLLYTTPYILIFITYIAPDCFKTDNKYLYNREIKLQKLVISIKKTQFDFF